MPAPVAVTLDVPARDAEVAADALWVAGAGAVAESNAGGLVRLVAAFDDEEAARAAVRDAVRVAPTSHLAAIGAVEDGWQDEWRRYATITRAGAFVIRPAWLPLPADLAASESIVVDLDPGRAFGDGSHPSTRLAVTAMAPLVADRRVTVLDAGCGSGVVSVAAALLGARVTAIDRDPEAVDVTRRNAARNGVEVDAHLCALDRFDARAARGYDVVVVNLGGTVVVVDTAAVLAPLVADGGALVVSGILAGAERPAVDALATAGLTLARRLEEDGWCAVVVRR